MTHPKTKRVSAVDGRGVGNSKTDTVPTKVEFFMHVGFLCMFDKSEWCIDL